MEYYYLIISIIIWLFNASSNQPLGKEWKKNQQKTWRNLSSKSVKPELIKKKIIWNELYTFFLYKSNAYSSNFYIYIHIAYIYI